MLDRAAAADVLLPERCREQRFAEARHPSAARSIRNQPPFSPVLLASRVDRLVLGGTLVVSVCRGAAAINSVHTECA